MDKDLKSKYFLSIRFSDKNIELINKTRKALGLEKTEYLTKAVEEFNCNRNISGRPSELEEFYIAHGKPLEVGMPVRDNNDREFTVFGIVHNPKAQKVEVKVSHDGMKMDGYWTYPPLDLKPIL